MWNRRGGIVRYNQRIHNVYLHIYIKLKLILNIYSAYIYSDGFRANLYVLFFNILTFYERTLTTFVNVIYTVHSDCVIGIDLFQL